MLRRSLGRYRKSVLLFLSAIACCALLYVAYHCYVLVVGGRHELRQAIAEADRLDPGWRRGELENSRAAIPDNENSALQVLKVDRLIPAKWWEAQREESSSSANRDTSQLLEMMKNPLLEARKLAGYQKGRFPSNPSAARFISPSLTGSAQRVAGLLDWDARVLTEKGKTDEAMISCRAILAAARSIGDEPEMVSQQIRVNIRNPAVRSIERTLANGETSEEILRQVQADLQMEESQPLLLVMARAERAFFHERLQACEDGDVPFDQVIGPMAGPGYDVELLTKPMLPHSHAWVIRYFNELVAACKEPADEQRAMIRIVAASGTSAPGQLRWLFSAMPELHLRTTDSVLTGRGLLRCAVTGLACERFRLRNNRWPKNLTELVPDYLKEVPSDPIHGTPLEMRVLQDKVTVYFAKLKGFTIPGTEAEDIASSKESEVSFTLWSPSQRGKSTKEGKNSVKH